MFTWSTQIINRKKIQKFIKHFAHEDVWHENDLMAANLGYGWIHYGIIRMLRANNILCIGSRYGYIPAVCALACRDNGSGIVDFVDAGYDQDNAADAGVHWGGVGIWNQADIARKQLSSFGLKTFIALHAVTSENFAHTHRAKIWDYIHIDGDHSYMGVKSDYKHFWPKLRKGGFMCFHDIHQYGVKKFWREIKKQHRTIEYPGEYGLGIIQK